MGLATLTLAFGVRTPQRGLIAGEVLSKVIKLTIVAAIAIPQNIAAQKKTVEQKTAKLLKTVAIIIVFYLPLRRRNNPTTVSSTMRSLHH
jgi:hypothetical protein